MAKLNFDTLKPKDWIVILSEKDDGEWKESDMRQRAYTPNGHPLEVLSVDLPFILIEEVNGKIWCVDTRRYVVQRASKHFVQTAVKVFYEDDMEPLSGTRKRKSRIISKPKKLKVKKDPRDCPYCGARMIHRRVEKIAGWRHVCPECGFDKGPVEAK